EPGEVAWVIDAPEARVRETLEAALEAGERLFGAEPPSASGDVRGALLEAFAMRAAASPSVPPTGPAPLAPGALIAERYELEARLGSGAYAEVFRARDRLVPDHVVALKILAAPVRTEEGRAHALREIRCLAAVFHPSVAQLKDHGWHADRLWIAMPFYEGETLEARLARGPLTRREALAIFRPLALALDALHAVGVRHQDVKPDNVLLARVRGGGEAGELLPVLIDFGVAVGESETFLAGTPEYFAPEMAARLRDELPDRPIDAKADVFSLALCLRDALSPSCFRAEEEALEETIARRATEAPRLPPEPELRDLQAPLGRWLALEAGARPTAAALAEELDVLLEPERRRAQRRRRLRWGLRALFTFLLVGGAIGYGLHRRAEAHRAAAERAEEQAAEQRSQARRARARAERVETALHDESEQRLALEDQVRALRESALSRDELARRLAEAEAERDELQARVVRERMRLQRQRRANEDLMQAYARLRDDLAAARARATAASRAAGGAPGEAPTEEPAPPPPAPAGPTE
ncbi:MAG TPA: serine/threonine-protein kinase, partial [Polyangiaceae bacterium LLY-WYZ-15_(1-7)]|nr:serine/threonine-protein kinase [Polyangiaceae bacterium LLY-WYZ-15_(1-7)]